jgi:hypothetical protein
VYFRGLAPSQYLVVAPMFVTADDPATRTVVLQPGLPIQDMQPGGLVSGPDMRAYTTAETRIRLHQQRFKLEVMRAYQHRCALRERSLVQARAVRDPSPRVRPQRPRHRSRRRRACRPPAAGRDRRPDAPYRLAGLSRLGHRAAAAT